MLRPRLPSPLAPALALAALVAGCGEGGSSTPSDPELLPSTYAAYLSVGDDQRVLDLVNSCSSTASLLDTKAGLDARAAKNIAAHRDGADAQCGTADDSPFSDTKALDAVPYVGDAAFKLLRAFAQAHPASGTGTTVSLAGTFDGVAFDEATARIALDLANQASAGQLTGHGVVSSTAAKILVARPFLNLKQVAALPGVGTATVTALRTYAQSGAWPPPPAGTCIGTFESAVRPLLPAVLFLSESDRPFDVVSFSGAGNAAPTMAALLKLTQSDPSSRTEVRPVDRYFGNIEPAGRDFDQNAPALLLAAVKAQLSSLSYFAIKQGGAAVDVYLVGVTACGDLVGLHAISIET